jgi:hypothetical protein
MKPPRYAGSGETAAVSVVPTAGQVFVRGGQLKTHAIFFGWLQLDFLCCPFFHLAYMPDPVSDSSLLRREKTEYLIAAHGCIAWAPFASVCHYLADPKLVRHRRRP